MPRFPANFSRKLKPYWVYDSACKWFPLVAAIIHLHTKILHVSTEIGTQLPSVGKWELERRCDTIMWTH